jgi:ankyrin repeat protein
MQLQRQAALMIVLALTLPRGIAAVPPPPVYVAVQEKNLHGARELLAAGADINSIDNKGRTALHLALHMSEARMAEVLLEHGAKVNTSDFDGTTPLLTALRFELNPALVQTLIDRGAAVDVVDAGGFTPLHYVSLRGRTSLARQLLEKHANPNATTRVERKTPLHIAAEWGQLEVTELLLDHGAQIGAREQYGFTPLAYAVASGKQAVTELLVSRGAMVDARSDHGDTPLVAAIVRDNIAGATLLLNHGAAIDPKDDEGRTPLRRAVMANKIAAARFLIERGANLRAANAGDDGTLLQIAKKNNQQELIQLLTGKSASPAR